MVISVRCGNDENITVRSGLCKNDENIAVRLVAEAFAIMTRTRCFVLIMMELIRVYRARSEEPVDLSDSDIGDHGKNTIIVYISLEGRNHKHVKKHKREKCKISKML